jgi:Membrane dipeptidase (Peptidase family M19)
VLALLSNFFPATRPIARQGMPTYPVGLRCNSRGLTPLGRFMINQMIKAHMLIEVDHMSERARDTVLSIAAKAHYPLISSHNGTGGQWTPAELVKLYRLGGFAAVTPDTAPALAAKILRMQRFKDRSRFFAVGIGTDTNGFASLPGPDRKDPLRYPFKSYDGRVTFARERTGRRTFDLNTDGVAHYGLMADLLADMRHVAGGPRALALLFGSAEAYLETWQRAISHR